MATGGQNLGGAVYTVTANTAPFTTGLKQAQQQAQQASSSINSSLAVIPRQLAAINQTAMSTTAAVQLLTEKIGKLGSTSRQAQGSMSGFNASGLLTISYIVDDLQYGFGAIVNNIPQLGIAIGHALGMSTVAAQQFGGALGIVAVATNLIIEHWGTLNNVLTSIVYDKPLAELEKVRVKAEQAAEAFDKLASKLPKAQQAQAAGVSDLFAEKGQGAVLAGVTSSIANDPAARSGVSPAEQAKLRSANALQGSKPGVAAQLRREVAEARNARDREAASKLVGEATLPGPAGDRARERIQFFAKRNPKAFPDELAQDLQNLTPKGQKDIEQGRLNREGNHRNRVAADEAKEAKNKRIDELNLQGQEGNEIAVRERDRQAKEARRDKLRSDMAKAHRLNEQDDARKHIRKIMSKPFGLQGRESQFFGGAEFAKQMQTGILNNKDEIQKQQLERLNQIKEILEKNGMGMMKVRGIMVAGTPA